MKIKTILLLLAIVTFARAGEYPIITNNAIVDCESDSDLEKEELGKKEYLLFKNQLIDMRKIEFEIPNPKRASDADICLPVCPRYTGNCHSPRNFLVGEYTSTPSKFVWQKSKLLNPRIKGLSAYIISDSDPDGPFDFDDPDDDDSVSRFLGLGNIRAVEIYPPQMKVKLDKPGATKALRDWYLLAPFYDPAAKTYRETLDKTDFIANPNNGFDPDAADFNPQKFVKKMVPYTLPEGYWKSVQGP